MRSSSLPQKTSHCQEPLGQTDRFHGFAIIQGQDLDAGFQRELLEDRLGKVLVLGGIDDQHLAAVPLQGIEGGPEQDCQQRGRQEAKPAEALGRVALTR